MARRREGQAVGGRCARHAVDGRKATSGVPSPSRTTAGAHGTPKTSAQRNPRRRPRPCSPFPSRPRHHPSPRPTSRRRNRRPWLRPRHASCAKRAAATTTSARHLSGAAPTVSARAFRTTRLLTRTASVAARPPRPGRPRSEGRHRGPRIPAGVSRATPAEAARIAPRLPTAEAMVSAKDSPTTPLSTPTASAALSRDVRLIQNITTSSSKPRSPSSRRTRPSPSRRTAAPRPRRPSRG